MQTSHYIILNAWFIKEKLENWRLMGLPQVEQNVCCSKSTYLVS